MPWQDESDNGEREEQDQQGLPDYDSDTTEVHGANHNVEHDHGYGDREAYGECPQFCDCETLLGSLHDDPTMTHLDITDLARLVRLALPSLYADQDITVTAVGPLPYDGPLPYEWESLPRSRTIQERFLRSNDIRQEFEDPSIEGFRLRACRQILLAEEVQMLLPNYPRRQLQQRMIDNIRSEIHLLAEAQNARGYENMLSDGDRLNTEAAFEAAVAYEDVVAAQEPLFNSDFHTLGAANRSNFSSHINPNVRWQDETESDDEEYTQVCNTSIAASTLGALAHFQNDTPDDEWEDCWVRTEVDQVPTPDLEFQEWASTNGWDDPVTPRPSSPATLSLETMLESFDATVLSPNRPAHPGTSNLNAELGFTFGAPTVESPLLSLAGPAPLPPTPRAPRLRPDTLYDIVPHLSISPLLTDPAPLPHRPSAPCLRPSTPNNLIPALSIGSPLADPEPSSTTPESPTAGQTPRPTPAPTTTPPGRPASWPGLDLTNAPFLSDPSSSSPTTSLPSDKEEGDIWIVRTVRIRSPPLWIAHPDFTFFAPSIIGDGGVEDGIVSPMNPSVGPLGIMLPGLSFFGCNVPGLETLGQGFSFDAGGDEEMGEAGVGDEMDVDMDGDEDEDVEVDEMIEQDEDKEGDEGKAEDGEKREDEDEDEDEEEGETAYELCIRAHAEGRFSITEEEEIAAQLATLSVNPMFPDKDGDEEMED